MPLEPPPTLLQLFLSFLRLGLTAFGGPSMIAYIRRVAVEQKRWLETDTFNDGVALCQMIPGATAMQTSAYVGLRARGVAGAAISYLGFGLPACLMMLLFAAGYNSFHTLPAVIASFSGLQAIIVAIIANAGVTFGRAALKSWQTVVMAVIAAALYALNVNPVVVVVLAAAGGLAFGPVKPVSPAHSRPMAATLRPLLGLAVMAGLGLLALFALRRPLFDMAITLVKVDLLAFGGGYTSVPLMFHEFVEVHHWLDGPTFMNGIVLGQVTPGPIVITATFIGYLLFGLAGGLLATISIFLPSFLLVVGLAPYFDQLRASPALNKVISGILCSFVGLLFSVALRFAGNVAWDPAHLLLAGGAFVALLLKVDLLWVIGLGTVTSIVLFR